jgi:hypothetical protein
MVDAVKLLAGVAFSPDSEAALHTRVVAAKQLIDVAGVSPPPPAAPISSIAAIERAQLEPE